MKKIYMLISVLTLSLAVNAQNGKSVKPADVKEKATLAKLGGNGNQTSALDTLAPPFHSDTCFTNNLATALTLYVLDDDATIDSGFVSGNNFYGDLEKAQKYSAVGNVTVTGALVGTYVVNTASTSNTSIKIYGVNATTKGPSTQMGTSSATQMVNALAANGYSTYTFGTPVTVNNVPFFVSYVLPTGAADMMAIFHTRFDCVSSDSLSWEKWSDASWHSFVHPSNWGINVDLAIYPIVNFPSGVEESSITKNGLSLYPAYPSPANTEITLNYALSNGGAAEINVFDATGRIVKTIKNKDLGLGKQSTKIEVSSLASGIYMYSVEANGTKLFSKFTVVK